MEADLIVVKTQAGANCEENDGIPPGLFVVSRAEWEMLKTLVANSSDPCLNRDLSIGSHGCILEDDLQDLVGSAEVVEEKPSKEILGFVRKAGDDSFLDKLREWASEEKSVVYLVSPEPEYKEVEPIQIDVFACEKDARKAAGSYGYVRRVHVRPVQVPETDDTRAIRTRQPKKGNLSAKKGSLPGSSSSGESP
jgi:hypothetical protein